jgi:hypothetical protein
MWSAACGLCFYYAVGPTIGTTDSPRLLLARAEAKDLQPTTLDLCPSLYPSFLYLEPYSDPPPPPPPPTMSSETLGSPSHPRPLPSVAVRTPFLPSLLHPASPRRAAGDRGPLPTHHHRGRGSPARAPLSGRGPPLTRRRHWGRGPLLGRHRMDEVLCSPT